MTLTIQQCKSLIFKSCVKTGANPKEVSEKLLSAQDKDAMLNGYVSQHMLETAIKYWMDVGRPDYVCSGKGEVV